MLRKKVATSAMEKHVELENIGLLKIVKHHRSKNFRVTIRPFEGLRLSIPKRVSFKDALSFIDERRDWLEKWVARHRTTMDAVEKSSSPHYTDGEKVCRNHRLRLKSWKKSSINVVVRNNFIHVNYSEVSGLDSPEVIEAIQKGIIRALKIEAHLFLPERLAKLADMHGFSYNRLALKNVRSRWGSCSSQNNINLNIHLMRLENKLVDYVLIHELCHTIEKNHSKRFWDLLEKTLPGARALDKMLNRAPRFYF
ncbi:MAG: SprT family zinc-dependent metalloprotease [Leptospirales bacterium]